MKQLLAILYPALEIFLFVKVGQAIGGLATVALVFGSAGLGFWLFNVKCKQSIKDITKNVDEGSLHQQGIFDSIIFFIAGVLLIVPGIFTTIVGLLLLIPFVRKLAMAKAGTSLYKYSQAPHSPFRSVSRLFVFDSGTGEFRSATSQSETDEFFSSHEEQATASSDHAIVIDCEPISPNSDQNNPTSQQGDKENNDCTFRSL